MSKNCNVCDYFTAYYTKAYICFLRAGCGHCSQQEQTVNKTGNCEKWKYRSTNRKKKKGAIIEELVKALTTINAIKLILEEENRPD